MTYLLTIGHTFPNPVHYAISVLGSTAGFGLGLVLRSPRVNVHVHDPRSSPHSPTRPI